jgi:hypothetical protein
MNKLFSFELIIHKKTLGCLCLCFNSQDSKSKITKKKILRRLNIIFSISIKIV